MAQHHKDLYKNSNARLEYAYLLFNKFIMSRINSELIKLSRILMLFLMTKFVRVFLKNCFTDFFLLMLGVSSQLLFVTEYDIKIWPILIDYEIILLIMNLLNSRYAYSNLNIEFWYTSLWHCTIHFKSRVCYLIC